MAASRVLIVDTPALGLWSLAARLRAATIDVVEVVTTEAAVAAIGRGVGVLVFHHAASVDLHAVVGRAREDDSARALLVVVDTATESACVPSVLGTAEVLRLPCDLAELTRPIAREVAAASQRHQVRALQAAVGPALTVESLLGESEVMARIRTVIRRLGASVGVPTLVSGGRGTGRTLVARIVHDTSDRRGRPFIHVECSSRPSLAAELLGSRTDGRTEDGALVWADEGTLFLENVDRLTSELQVAVLRVLEEGLVQRPGSTVDRAASVRVVASTAADLEVEIDAGRFRRDLYYRLNVVRLDLPPLRRRGHDVVDLAAHFAALEGVAQRRLPALLDASAGTPLLAYDWPGNVGELRQVISRAVLLAGEEVLTHEHLERVTTLRRPSAVPFSLPEEGVKLDALERQLVVDALQRTAGNQTRAAALLGLHRDQIRYRMLKYGLRR